MKLYIMRHGETDWNVEVRLQGCTDISLNENGIKLAEITGEALKDVKFDVAYSSPLGRAMETARLALNNSAIPIIPDERIQEISFGEWEGRRCGRQYNEIPVECMQYFFHDTAKYVAPPGGESFEEILARTGDFYEELIHKEEYENSNILISTHGAAVRALLQSVYRDGDFWHGGVPKNCSVTIVELEHGKVVSVEPDLLFYEESDTDKSFTAFFKGK